MLIIMCPFSGQLFSHPLLINAEKYTDKSTLNCTGLQIRRVDISSTDKDYIESKLWLSSDSDVSTLLWQDPDQISWELATHYRCVSNEGASLTH